MKLACSLLPLSASCVFFFSSTLAFLFPPVPPRPPCPSVRRFTNWRTCLSSLGAVFESRWHLGYVASTVFLCRRNRSRKTAPRVDGRLTPIVPVTSVSSAFVSLHTVQSRAVSKAPTLRQTLCRVKRTFEKIAKLTPLASKSIFSDGDASVSGR